MTKEFRETTSNTVGTDMSVYKVMYKYQFACDFMSPIRVNKLPVVLKLDDEPNLPLTRFRNGGVTHVSIDMNALTGKVGARHALPLPVMIRRLDKLIDELAEGKSMENILRK
jgi:hypothetical protein